MTFAAIENQVAGWHVHAVLACLIHVRRVEGASSGATEIRPRTIPSLIIKLPKVAGLTDSSAKQVKKHNQPFHLLRQKRKQEL